MSDRSSIPAGPLESVVTTAEEPRAVVERSSRYSWFVLFILMVVYALNFVDRTIVSILGQAIKEDLKLADWQVGALGGMAFVLLYTVLGFPIAKLADRGNRVAILSVCIVVWSAMTAVCGLAGNFVQLFLARIGVGIGEAGCVPTAHSLIADYFPPHKRVRALSVFAVGVPLGTIAGMIAGGLIVQHHGWRIAFFVVGLPGILIALALWQFVREPVRGGSERDDDAKAAALADAPPSLGVTGRTLWKNPTTRNLSIAMTLSIVSSNGITTFQAPYLIRMYGLSYVEVAAIVGGLTLVSITTGIIGGGFLADALGRRDKRWYAWLPAIGFLIAGPLYVISFLQDDWRTMIAFNLVAHFATANYLAPGFAVIHNILHPRMRAGASAFVLFGMNLFGMGFGPVLVGLLIDMLAQGAFHAHALGNFASSCPGGLPRVHGDAAAALCRSTLAHATRWAFVLWQPFCLWTALHFFLASKTIRRDMP